MDWITLREAQALLPEAMSLHTVRTMVRRGSLRSRKFMPNGQIFVYKPDVEALVAAPDSAHSSSFEDSPLPGF